MNRLIKETDQVIKLNLRQLVIFEVLFRLVAGTFYIRLVNQLLRFSLRMAGYSYLTMSNMGAFLLRPATIVCALLAAVLGAMGMKAGAYLQPLVRKISGYQEEPAKAILEELEEPSETENQKYPGAV